MNPGLALYPLDPGLPWGHQAALTVTGNGSRYGTLNWGTDILLLPAVSPTFRLDRTIASPGATILVTGEHWNPGEAVTLHYCRDGLHNGVASAWPFCVHGSQQDLAVATIDAHGNLRQQVTIPANARLGVITIEAADVPGDVSGGHGVAVRLGGGPRFGTWSTRASPPCAMPH